MWARGGRLSLATRDVPPSASALISSLRGVGYSLQTAIADILDNSIAAAASRIEIEILWGNQDTVVTILDDGSGMSEHRLIEAMRFGGAGPDVKRAEGDLGRFGLGLKTASLSQCRQLTVASKIGSTVSAFAWDLDIIAKGDGGWPLVDGREGVPAAELKKLRAQASGTLVVWRKVDFGRENDRPDEDALLAEIDLLDRHLSMVFHRFLRGDGLRIRVSINGHAVSAWDPFLENHEATIPLPVQKIGGPRATVTVRGFVLPHRDRFRNEAEYEQAGGPEGWTAQQGFYVYRQKRLLSAGGWLGLGGSRTWTREEPSRLARIRLDIPNTADRDWHIDIRKAIARPPDSIRPKLQAIAENVRKRAREVFVYRGLYGGRTKTSTVTRIWEVGKDSESRRYRISRDHELILALQKQLGKKRDLLDAALDLIERTVPVERVWLDITEQGTPPPPTPDDTEAVSAANHLIEVFTKIGVPYADAVSKVALMEPFDAIKDLRERLTARGTGRAST